jgi:tetratricopeptide (TPR) repeat protein
LPREDTSPLYKANTLVSAGVTLMDDRKFDKAVSCFDEALGYTADIWYLKGTALRCVHNYKDALTCFEMALKLNPKHPHAKMDLGVALHYIGKYRRAIGIYDALIKEGQSVPLAWFNKACALCMLGKDEKALECLRKAKELDPFNTNKHLAVEESFERLRGTPDFEALAEEIRGCEAGQMSGNQNLCYIG